MTVSLELATTPDDTLRAQIAAPLLAFNGARAGPSGHQALVLVLRQDDGAVIGGLWGATTYGWLYTQMLVVPEALRGQGWGARLMQRAEALARERGCIGAWVDTQFGARGFYERLGYAAFGELPDHPPGFTRTFLSKRLDTAA